MENLILRVMYLNKFIRIVSNPSNILNKITIVEGWSNKQLNLNYQNILKI